MFKLISHSLAFLLLVLSQTAHSQIRFERSQPSLGSQDKTNPRAEAMNLDEKIETSAAKANLTIPIELYAPQSPRYFSSGSESEENAQKIFILKSLEILEKLMKEYRPGKNEVLSHLWYLHQKIPLVPVRAYHRGWYRDFSKQEQAAVYENGEIRVDALLISEISEAQILAIYSEAQGPAENDSAK